MIPHTRKTDLGRIRDTVESIYIAIVLAFVLRAFLVEAFVIPTGSMATCLYGEHLELTCPCCGQAYTYGLNRTEDGATNDGLWRPAHAVCPNCSMPYRAAPDPLAVPARGGDRVIVLKYLYDFRDPKPWDVVVFKNPQNNRENYIKRLIGLPGESIEILQGDIFAKGPKDRPWRIRRKPWPAQEVMWQLLYDGDHRPDAAMLGMENIVPAHWQRGQDGERWALGDEHDPAGTDVGRFDGRVFAVTPGETPATLDFVPGPRGFLAYNSYNANEKNIDPDHDLCLDWRLATVLWPSEAKAAGEFTITFDRFDDRFRAVFSYDGTVRLLHAKRLADGSGQETWDEWGQMDVGPFTPAAGREVALVHVDYRASVWVDGKLVLESSDAQYPGSYALAESRATLDATLAGVVRTLASLEAELASPPLVSGDEASKQTAAWKAQAAELRTRRAALRQQRQWFHDPRITLSATGAPAALWHLSLHRDTYYTCPPLQRLWDSVIGQGREYDYARARLNSSDRSYAGWGTTGHPIQLHTFPDDSGRDEFFCLGDNSPESLDGRGWSAAAPTLQLYDAEGNNQYQFGTVPRYNMVGRAMLVYWPAGYPLGLFPGRLGQLPIIPNVGRMRLIR